MNIGTLQGKSVELVKILKKRRINIACVQETRWVGSKARDVDGHKLCVYAPQVGLDEVARSVPSSDKIIIAGDFNGHIGVLLGGYNDVYEGFGFGDRNGEGAALFNFASFFGLVHRLLVMDFSIKKSKKRRVGEGRPRIKWGSLTPVSTLEIREKVARIGVWECRGDVDIMWDRAVSCITETAR
ncbi:uncharacterized protein LOC124898473 [Capsicum annuum]|uniref:uncharacterized protein LOC124898473 n=1 Tax=Capsicum annuum TaxID=4072 RepID=UPI001FB17B6E|nr:uncharacterized protein LOC124898473 [Capsicum annuum]